MRRIPATGSGAIPLHWKERLTFARRCRTDRQWERLRRAASCVKPHGDTCESCYAALGQPETIAYICQGCGGESRYPERCEACADARALDSALPDPWND
jgi:hypothetical protein